MVSTVSLARVKISSPSLRELVKASTKVPNPSPGARDSQHFGSPSPPTILNCPLESTVAIDDIAACGLDFATLDEVTALHPYVSVYAEDQDWFLCHGPLDYYLLDNLKEFTHSFQSGHPPPAAHNSTREFMTLPCMAERVRPNCTMLRSDGQSGLFDRFFGGLHLNLLAIVNLVLKFGLRNPMRDGSSPTSVRSRIDFGCAGDGFEKIPGGGNRPYVTYGFDVFENLVGKEKAEVMQSYADVFDAMQDCEDYLETVRFGNSKPYNFPPRTEEYGCGPRRKLGGKRMRQENFTTQVKIVSWYHPTDGHKDIRNCSWFGYTKTGALCFMLKCRKTGLIISIKFITNSRDKVGRHYDSIGLKPILNRIQSHVDAIDQAYKFIHKQQQLNESKSITRSTVCGGFGLCPDYLNFHRLNLNDYSPWVATKIGMNPVTGEDVVADVIEMPANIVRSYFLSPACTLVHRMKRHLQLTRADKALENEKRLVELAVLAGYQTDMLRIYSVGMNHFSDLDCCHPSKVLAEMLMTEYGSLTGTSGCKRINPTGIDFHATYVADKEVIIDGVTHVDKEKEMNGAMPFVVTRILKLMDDINENMTSGKFCDKEAEKMFKACCKSWRSLALDIGEFRLMIVVLVREI